MPKGRISLEELASLPNVLAPTPSWSGDRIAFFWNKTGRFELYTLHLVSRELRQVSDGGLPATPRSGFAWTRDDTAVIFGKDAAGDEQHNLYRLELETGAITELTSDPHTQEYALEAHPDGRRLLVASTRAGQVNLFGLDLVLETHEWRQLTSFKAPVYSGRWSPDGARLALSSNESADLRNVDGYVVRDDGSGLEKVFSVREGSQDTIADWHPDGRRLAVTSDAEGENRVGLLVLETGEVGWLGALSPGVSETAGRFSRDGRWLAVSRNEDSSLAPVLYEVETGEERLLNLPPGLAAGASFVLGDEKLLVQHQTATRRNELLLYDLASDTAEVLLPAEYGSIDPALFVEDGYVRYPSFDSQEVPAIVYRPRDARPGERLPALVMVHGGPTAQWLRGFNETAQFLADRGFVLLLPNIRGSTGYGTAWRDANIKDWGGADLEDVAAGAEYLKSLPEVDPERIGIYGGSFGGYMSFIAAVKKPDLFKVAVPEVGISDLHQLYEDNSRSMPQLGYYFRHMMGDPVADTELWRDRSAITHARMLKAKLLIIHGRNDPRCPLNQAERFRARLLELGRVEGEDFEYLVFEDGHGTADIEGKTRNRRLLADFLERRL